MGPELAKLQKQLSKNLPCMSVADEIQSVNFSRPGGYISTCLLYSLITQPNVLQFFLLYLLCPDIMQETEVISGINIHVMKGTIKALFD